MKLVLGRIGFHVSICGRYVQVKTEANGATRERLADMGMERTGMQRTNLCWRCVSSAPAASMLLSVW